MRTGTIRKVLLAGGLLAALASPAAAQGIGDDGRMRTPGPGRMLPGQWWKNPEMVEALGLDDSTRQQIEDEVYRSQQEGIGLRAEAERQELELQRLLQSQDAEVDLRSIEQQVDRVVRARGAVMKEEIMLRARIMALLSPEQRQKLETLFQQRRERFRDGAIQRRRPRDSELPPPDDIP